MALQTLTKSVSRVLADPMNEKFHVLCVNSIQVSYLGSGRLSVRLQSFDFLLRSHFSG